MKNNIIIIFEATRAVQRLPSNIMSLKAYIQEVLSPLSDGELRAVSSTLHIKIETVEESRVDLTRKIANLAALDSDTSLGVLLSWCHLEKKGIKNSTANDDLYQKQTVSFVPSFLPKMSGTQESSNSKFKNNNVLDTDIAATIVEIDELEIKFKKMEHSLHQGVPSYEKVKNFQQHLTWLRTKETNLRLSLIEKNIRLTLDKNTVTALENETRNQLEFFITGYTKLRKRHDHLLFKTSTLSALDGICSDIYLSLAASECAFSSLMENTVHKTMKAHDEMKMKLNVGSEKVAHMEATFNALETKYKSEKTHRLVMQKSAGVTTLQLRKTRIQLKAALVESSDSLYIRSHLSALKRHVLSSLDVAREEAYSALKSVKNKKLDPLILGRAFRPFFPILKLSHIAYLEPKSTKNNAYMRYVHSKKVTIKMDTARVIRGIILVGIEYSGRRTQAELISNRFGHVAIDMDKLFTGETELLNSTEEEFPEDEEKDLLPQEIVKGEKVVFDINIVLQRLRQPDCMSRGWILFNWEFTKKECDLMIGSSLPLDLVLFLEVRQSVLQLRKMATGTTQNNTVISNTSTNTNQDNENRPVSSYAEDRAKYKSLHGLGLLFVSVPGDEAKESVAATLAAAILKTKRLKCTPGVQWDEKTRMVDEQHLMFMNELVSRLLPKIVDKRKIGARKNAGRIIRPLKKGRVPSPRKKTIKRTTKTTTSPKKTTSPKAVKR